MKFFALMMMILSLASQAQAQLQVRFDSEARDLLSEFPLIVVVNKSASGPGAQHVRIFVEGQFYAKDPVSTGREQHEKSKSGKEYFSSTGVGWFSPTRHVENHYSQTWEAFMPFSTFFNGGIALHAALPGAVDRLGTRASGGCVRMMPDIAEAVYRMSKGYGQGRIPSFSRYGGLHRDASGQMIYTTGWRTLIIVEENKGQKAKSHFPFLDDATGGLY